MSRILDWIFAPKDFTPLRWLIYVPVWMLLACVAGMAFRELVL
jgi:hypothetical protein|tara:strand:- start:1095 stop:1223 length:129 start_codon:yes stop_codon:yes gene_type:complete